MPHFTSSEDLGVRLSEHDQFESNHLSNKSNVVSRSTHNAVAMLLQCCCYAVAMQLLQHSAVENTMPMPPHTCLMREA